MTDRTPTTASVRYAYAASSAMRDTQEFDAWLTAHDAEVRKDTSIDIAARIRQNCTPPGDAYDKGGDALIYAVASWIENPPEWVKASWT